MQGSGGIAVGLCMQHTCFSSGCSVQLANRYIMCESLDHPGPSRRNVYSAKSKLYNQWYAYANVLMGDLEAKILANSWLKPTH